MTFTVTGTQNPHQIIVRKKIQKHAAWSRASRRATILAATIASFGLFANSPADFIGFMIEVPRIGPIEGFFLPANPTMWGDFGGGAK